MAISRRLFIRNGVATVGLGFAVPSFLSAVAEAQTAHTRNLVVVYLGGGNDGLNTLVSYQDPSYYSRRPTIAVPAGQVLQVGTDSAGHALGLFVDDEVNAGRTVEPETNRDIMRDSVPGRRRQMTKPGEPQKFAHPLVTETAEPAIFHLVPRVVEPA